MSSDSREMTKPSSSLTRSLILNQTIGLVALVCLITAVGISDRIQSLLSRSDLGAHVSGWFTEKVLIFRLVDLPWIVVMLGLMVGWTILFQLIVRKGRRISRGEWRPATSLDARAALYLVISASVVEETVFRGIVLPVGAHYLGPIGGLAASAILFGLLHLEKGPSGQIVVVGYGIILGGGMLVGCSFAACVAAHAAGNAMAFLLPDKFVGTARST